MSCYWCELLSIIANYSCIVKKKKKKLYYHRLSLLTSLFSFLSHFSLLSPNGCGLAMVMGCEPWSDGPMVVVRQGDLILWVWVLIGVGLWSAWVWSVNPKHLDSKSETSRDAKSQCHSVVSLLVVDQSILFFVGLSLWNFCFMGLSLWNLFFVGLSLWNFSILHESRFVKFVLGGSAIVG